MADALTDRVAFCVVKRNCNGPSVMTQANYTSPTHGRGATGDKWTCQHCGATAVVPLGEIPTFRRKIEP